VEVDEREGEGASLSGKVERSLMLWLPLMDRYPIYKKKTKNMFIFQYDISWPCLPVLLLLLLV
jgi:hypothetical protein